MTTQMFGAPIRRTEDRRLVTGQGRYLDDLGEGALAAAFVRSPHAHARVLDVDVSDALDVDGLVAIYTYEDLPEALAQPLPLLIPHPALTHPKTPYPLANGVVHHVGAPVAMVVARDRYVAEDVVDRVRVGYQPLPPVVGVETAARAEHLVHPDVPGNVAAHLDQEVGDVQAAIAAAPHRLELRWDIERSASTPMEGRGVYARWDSDDGALRVYSSTQISTSVRAVLATKFRLPEAKVEVIAPDVGGRLRCEDHAPVAGGGSRSLGGDDPRAGGEVGRGPPRALRRQRARARPGAPGDGRLRRRRAHPRPARPLPA